MSFDRLVRDLVTVVGGNGNYLINIAPQPDGSFSEDRIAAMDALGRWLLKHEDAVYGTRGGPFYPFSHGVSTRKGERAWLFITNPEFSGELTLAGPAQQLKKAHMFDTGKAVSFSQNDGAVSFDLSGLERDGPVSVIELEFAAPVEMAPVAGLQRQ